MPYFKTNINMVHAFIRFIFAYYIMSHPIAHGSQTARDEAARMGIDPLTFDLQQINWITWDIPIYIYAVGILPWWANTNRTPDLTRYSHHDKFLGLGYRHQDTHKKRRYRDPKVSWSLFYSTENKEILVVFASSYCFRDYNKILGPKVTKKAQNIHAQKEDTCMILIWLLTWNSIQEYYPWFKKAQRN
eukprot:25379_1